MFNNIKEVQGTLIPDSLFNSIKYRVEQLYSEVITLRIFSGEALIFALIEYSAFHRNMTKDERYIYLYEKAYLYENGKDCDPPTGVRYHDNGDIYINSIEELPF